MPLNLQCPKCNQDVSVGDSSAGKRVRCPHCQKEFLAPGFAATQNDDDDWLSLDSDDSAARAPIAQGVPVAELADGSADVASDDEFDEVELVEVDVDVEDVVGEDEDAVVLSKFGKALDEFTSEVEPLPTGGPKTADPFDGLPPPDQSGAQPVVKSSVGEIDAEFMIPDLPAPAEIPGHDVLPLDESFSTPLDDDLGPDVGPDFRTPPPTADDVEYASEYRVKCNICGSILYAKARQAGKTIRCNDCHSDVKVPRPPKVKQKPKIDVENARTFSFEETSVPEKKREDPFRKSARELLDEAEKSEDETPGEYRDPDIPSMREWAMNVFGIFLDIGVIAHWLGLSILGGIPAAIVLSIGQPLLYALSAALALVFITLTIACGFAIMQSVANKHETVENWPEADPSAWFDDLVVAVSAVALAAAPMLTLTSFAFGPGLTSTALTMMSIYLTFPFFVLSMIDMQSIFTPFSPEVARSVTRCQEAWGALYLSSGLLFFGLFLFFVMISSASAGPAAAIAVAATIAVTFSYFSMIGRLAFAIGQPVNDPAKNSKKALDDGEQKSEPN